MNIIKHIILLLAVSTFGLGCSQRTTPTETTTGSGPEAYPFKVVTTVGMVNDIVRQVAGERAECRNVIGEGVDPHLFKPTRSDVAALLHADVIFYSGLMLEGKMGDVLVKVATKGKPVYAVTELIDESYLLEPEDSPGHHDPHVWMDVKGWIAAVDAVSKSLAEFDAAHAEEYQARADALKKEMGNLDEYIIKTFQSVPENQRLLITAHDAFNYFGRAYGLEVRGIQGLSTESEAGLEDINNLVDLIVGRKVKAVFVESSVADKNVKALVEGAQSRGHNLVIGGQLYSDAMGPAGSYEGTYLGMLDHNATVIARALGGEAPAKGFDGKLTVEE